MDYSDANHQNIRRLTIEVPIVQCRHVSRNFLFGKNREATEYVLIVFCHKGTFSRVWRPPTVTVGTDTSPDRQNREIFYFEMSKKVKNIAKKHFL